LSILLAAFIVIRGVSYLLDRYSLTTKTDLITGIQYTDATVVLPTKTILAVASFLCAIAFLSVLWTRSWRIPIISVVSLLVVSIVVGGIFPALIQSLKVKPSEKSLEAPYIQNNINATRDAFGLANIQTTAYNAATTATQGQLRNDTATVWWRAGRCISFGDAVRTGGAERRGRRSRAFGLGIAPGAERESRAPHS